VSAPSAILITDALLRSWPLPSLEGSKGKEDRGRAMVVGGSREIPGGALLAAEAVLRVGAGKLHIATAAACQAGMGVAVPEAKVSLLIEDAEGHLAQAPPELEKEFSRADAILVGPGMETCKGSATLVQHIARACSCPLVLDAGALAGLVASPPPAGGRVITPHFGEMARLLDCTLEEVAADPAAMALEVARATDSVVVLKSPRTYVCCPDRKNWIHTDGSVGLGTSGSGDVLAGLITGLLARGADLDQAAVWGVRLHGKAGELLSKKIGTVGFLAREISPLVPNIMSGLAAPSSS
jgi:hydroxyethylthiazole kinase-like uncharacterized protein yjeF